VTLGYLKKAPDAMDFRLLRETLKG
jgi:hypothetical protein